MAASASENRHHEGEELDVRQCAMSIRTPQFAGIRAAVRHRPAIESTVFGGDWHDIIPLPRGRIGLVVGDVEGHDLTASSVARQVGAALRAHAAEGRPPEAVMARTDAFLRSLDADRFATCLYAELDPRTGLAQVVRAGHLSPIVQRFDGTTSRPDVTGGLPLGLSVEEPPKYRTGALRIGQGETLLMFTDGLPDCLSRDLEAALGQIETLLCTGENSGRIPDLEHLADEIMRPVAAWPFVRDDVSLLLVRPRCGNFG